MPKKKRSVLSRDIRKSRAALRSHFRNARPANFPKRPVLFTPAEKKLLESLDALRNQRLFSEEFKACVVGFVGGRLSDTLGFCGSAGFALSSNVIEQLEGAFMNVGFPVPNGKHRSKTNTAT